jgi:uncharacterized protein (TIGR02266 family)
MASATNTDLTRDLKGKARMLLDHIGSELFFFDYAKDLSATGIFLETMEPLPIGTRALLTFCLPQREKLITVLGEIVWSSRPRYSGPVPGMGIRFLDMNEPDRREIDRFLDRVDVAMMRGQAAPEGFKQAI